MKPPLRVHSTTHEGLVHDKNEDSHAVVPTDEGGVLLLVCDGMGGMGRGEVASALAVENITRLVGEGRGFPPERLRRAIRESDTIVRQELCSDGRGMPGSTAVMVYVLDGMGHVAWAGDSRAYLVRNGKSLERTRDHKLVNELIAAGQLTEEEAQSSALAHVVTRALGGRPPTDRPVKPSTLGHPWKLAHGDVIVLCSDGVCDLISDQEIADLTWKTEPEAAARSMVNLALDRGGHDNITCIIAVWDGEDYVEDEKATPSFGVREHFPDRDLRSDVPIEPGEDDGRGVTEELDPDWRPGDDDEGQDDLETLPVASNPTEEAMRTPPPAPRHTEARGDGAEPMSPGPGIVLALVVAAAVLIGLALALM